MSPSRRDLLKTAGVVALLAVVPFPASSQGVFPMYGLIGRAKAVSGQRDALMAMTLEGGLGLDMAA